MQTAARNREPDPRSFAARKGHVPQLSISDDTHHVTEAIGYMYGDEGSPTSPHQSRPSHRNDPNEPRNSELGSARNKPLPLRKVSYGEHGPVTGKTLSPSVMQNNGWTEQANGVGSGTSTVGRQRSPSETATSPFPLNNIDYESSPAAVQQELSNLQALRRMSMDVAATGDPDLPHLNTSAIPSAPSPASSEDDSARLFWVPARLHPELAPTEFKSFLESKAEQIKRRSGELSAFSSPMSSRSNSLSTVDSSEGLKRKKSMLSRQINNSSGYEDGADRLERKKSRGQKGGPLDNLSELETTISASESPEIRTSLEARIDEETGDIILPSVPGSNLKRSTRTKYQRTDSKKGREDRGTYAQRAAKKAGMGGQISPGTPADDVPPLPSFGDFSNLASTLKDPNVSPQKPVTKINFSRPGERSVSPPAPVPSPTFDTRLVSEEDPSITQNVADQRPARVQSPPLPPQQSDRPIPQIIESPPPEDRPVRTSSKRPANVYTIPATSTSTPEPQPQQAAPKPVVQRPGMPIKQSSVTLSNASRVGSRPSEMPAQTQPTQTLEQPSALPGQDTNTSNLSYIPTLHVDKRADIKKKEEKKSGWSWRLGAQGSDREAEKSKPKLSKPPQSHDNTRLDVLQTSIDGGAKGRESLVLDRENVKLDEDRKRDNLRKASSSSEKKEEKSGFFSSLFSSKKNKAEKEAHKKLQERLSPEPRSKELRPDIDYNWTRFSILEERAIYRMAHIKLANPRRALYSQVLLSNFMYSYLAKVQQMHPQMNLPTSAKQQRKQKEQEKQQQQSSQPDEYTQYQRYQQQQAQQQATQQQQQQYSQQGHEGDGSSAYGQDHSDNGNYAQSSPSSRQKSSSRGTKSSQDLGAASGSGAGNNSYSITGGGNSYYHQQSQQPHHQQQSRHNNHYNGRDDDDDDDDMW